MQQYAELTLPITTPAIMPRTPSRDSRIWDAVADEFAKLPSELLDDLHLDMEKVKARRLNRKLQAKVRRFVIAYLLSRGKSPYEIHLRLGLPKYEIRGIEKTLQKHPTATSNRDKQKTLMLFRIKEKEAAIIRQRTRLEAKGEKLLREDVRTINELVKTEINDIEGTRRKLLGLDAPVQHEVKQKRVATIRLVVHGSREQLEPMLDPAGIIDVPSLPAPAENQAAEHQDDCFPEIE